MVEKYGLFDSLEGDERVYAESDFALLIKAIAADGVRGGEEALKITPKPDGLGVNVQAGLAVIRGRYYALEDDGSGVKTMTLTTASAQPRIDRIVLCLDYGLRMISLSVLTGVEAAAPQAPLLTRNEAQYMISLAQVRVGVGAASLKESDITDERGDESVCGLHVASAQAAMNEAKRAGSGANAAKAAAAEAKQAASAAQTTADTGVTRAASALAEAQKRIPAVAGAAAGSIPVFDSNGNLTGSGKSFSDFTLARMTLSGSTLTITTIA